MAKISDILKGKTSNVESELTEAAKPLIKYMNENYDLHTQAIVTLGGVTIVNENLCVKILDYLK